MTTRSRFVQRRGVQEPNADTAHAVAWRRSALTTPSEHALTARTAEGNRRFAQPLQSSRCPRKLRPPRGQFIDGCRVGVLPAELATQRSVKLMSGRLALVVLAIALVGCSTSPARSAVDRAERACHDWSSAYSLIEQRDLTAGKKVADFSHNAVTEAAKAAQLDERWERLHLLLALLDTSLLSAANGSSNALSPDVFRSDEAIVVEQCQVATA
jgi:hypothetical protein